MKKPAQGGLHIDEIACRQSEPWTSRLSIKHYASRIGFCAHLSKMRLGLPLILFCDSQSVLFCGVANDIRWHGLPGSNTSEASAIPVYGRFRHRFKIAAHHAAFG